MYKHPTETAIAFGLISHLSDILMAYNTFDNHVISIGTLNQEKTKYQSAKSRKEWQIRSWSSTQREKEVQSWTLDVGRGWVESVVAISKLSYALLVISQKHRCTQNEEKENLMNSKQHVLIVQLPQNGEKNPLKVTKVQVNKLQSSAEWLKLQVFHQIRLTISYEQKYNILVLVQQFYGESSGSVHINNFGNPKSIIRVSYLNLHQLLQQNQLSNKDNIWQEFSYGFRTASKYFKIIHPFWLQDGSQKQSDKNVREAPILICYQPINILPNHLIGQQMDRKLYLYAFKMTKGILTWPNPHTGKKYLIKGYELGLDDGSNQLHGQNEPLIEAQVEIQELQGEQINEEQVMYDEQAMYEQVLFEQNVDDQQSLNVNELINGAIIHKVEGETLNLTLHTSHKNKQKLLNILLNLSENEGIVKHVSEFPLNSLIHGVLSVGGNAEYVWSWISESIVNNSQVGPSLKQQEFIYLMGLQDTLDYKLLYKLKLQDSECGGHPQVYISKDEIHIMKSPDLSYKSDKNKQQEQKGLTLLRMSNKKTLYLKMLKKIFEREGTQQQQLKTHLFVNYLAESTLALL